MSTNREQRLRAVHLLNHTYKNNLNQASKAMNVSRKMLRDWKAKEDDIVGSVKGSRRLGNHKKAKYPDMESVLINEFRGLRDKGIKVRPSWFKSRAKGLMLEMYPDEGKFDMGEGALLRVPLGLGFRVHSLTINDSAQILSITIMAGRVAQSQSALAETQDQQRSVCSCG